MTRAVFNHNEIYHQYKDYICYQVPSICTRNKSIHFSYRTKNRKKYSYNIYLHLYSYEDLYLRFIYKSLYFCLFGGV